MTAGDDETTFTPGGQMALFWRLLHMLTVRYGNYPVGQLLVSLTMAFLNARGQPPTMTAICDATGLPKSTVSRYVSWQIRHGLVEEKIDPRDRRQRRLVQTRKGRAEWESLVGAIDKLFGEMGALEKAERFSSGRLSAEALLQRLIEVNRRAKLELL